ATQVGKPALISADGDQPEYASTNYPALVAHVWDPVLAGGGKRSAYLSDVTELRRLKKREHDLYVLNYLPLDKLLHLDEQQIGQDATKLAGYALDDLVEAVAEFAERFEIGERLRVYVTSDHGSTRIGQDVVNVLDRDYFKG